MSKKKFSYEWMVDGQVFWTRRTIKSTDRLPIDIAGKQLAVRVTGKPLAVRVTEVPPGSEITKKGKVRKIGG